MPPFLADDVDQFRCKGSFISDVILNKADEFAGAAQFADAHLVLLPVRSLAGTFALVTSPYLLERLARDAAMAGDAAPELTPQPAFSEAGGEALVAPGSTLAASFGHDPTVVLEDLDLTLRETPALLAWADWLGRHAYGSDATARAGLAGRLCVVHDDVMSFLMETALEVTARIRLEDDLKTVAKGGLWYEESLPAETVLASLILAGPSRKRDATLDARGVLGAIRETLSGPVQLGGKATVGRGLCRLHLGGA